MRLTHSRGRALISLACVATAAACGCGFLGIEVSRHGVGVVVDAAPPPMIVAPPEEPVAAEPAPPPEPAPAPAPAPTRAPAMPMVGGQQVKLPVENRAATWRQFMVDAPVRLSRPFLDSQIELGEQYAMMMAMAGLQPGSVHFTVQHVLANFLLMAQVSPAFTIANWSAGPNEVSVSVLAGGETMLFTFRYYPQVRASRVFVTIDGETVDAWPIVFSMGLAVQ